MSDTLTYNNTSNQDALTATFVRRNEPNFAGGNAIGINQLLPQLRGNWPFSSIDENGDAFDISGQGRTLTNNGGATFGIYNALAPYASFDFVNDFFSRADEPGTSITGGLTMGCWCRPAVDAAIASRAVMTKWRFTTNNRSYTMLNVPGAQRLRFLISSLGTAATILEVNVSGVVINDEWNHCVARFVPSTSLDIFVNGVKTSVLAGVPAGIFDGIAPFQIGAQDSGTLFNGDISMPFLCNVDFSDALVFHHFQQTRALFGR